MPPASEPTLLQPRSSRPTPPIESSAGERVLIGFRWRNAARMALKQSKHQQGAGEQCGARIGGSCLYIGVGSCSEDTVCIYDLQ